MGRLGLAFAAVVSILAFPAAAAPRRPRPEPRAEVVGVSDRTLRQEIERAIGDAAGRPANRIESRRRARDAAASATALLRSEGYYDAEVQPDIGAGDRPGGVVRIALGARTRLAAPILQWVGPVPPPTAAGAALSGLKLSPGAPARAADVIAAEGRAVAALEADGYADARAEARDVVVDHAAKTMTATYRLAAGDLVRMDGMVLNDKGGRTRPGFIRKLAPWKPREVYRPDDPAELERRLLDTGVYDSVTVALAPKSDAEGLRPVVVSVADRVKHALSLGVGYSTTEGVLVDSSLSTYNVLHRADTLTLLAKVQTIDTRLGVSESLPDFLHPAQTLKVGPDVFRDVTNAYTTTGAELGADLTQRYGKSSFFTKGLSLVASRIDDHELGRLNIFAVRPLLALSFDRTDNTLDPHQGYKWDTRGEPTGVFGQEQLFYLRLQAQASTYLALGADADSVLAARVHVGSILGGKIPQLPASDRFFAGGGGSVRGYAYQNVGPHYADNTPQGGLSLIETSFEYRRRIAGPFGAVVFLDSGVVGSQATPTFSHIASGFGVGVRYDLGFAPVRVDVATPLNRLSRASQPPIQFYLSVGQAF